MELYFEELSKLLREKKKLSGKIGEVLNTFGFNMKEKI